MVGEQYSTGSLPARKRLLPLAALFILHLRGMLARFEAVQFARHGAIEIDEERIGAPTCFWQARHANRIVESTRAITHLPAHRSGLELIARHIGVVLWLKDDVDQPCLGKSFQQITNNGRRVL